MREARTTNRLFPAAHAGNLGASNPTQPAAPSATAPSSNFTDRASAFTQVQCDEFLLDRISKPGAEWFLKVQQLGVTDLGGYTAEPLTAWRLTQTCQRHAVIVKISGETFQTRQHFILGGYDCACLGQRPVNANSRVVPADTSVAVRRVDV